MVVRAIGHVIAAAIVNCGIGPGYFQPWLFKYIVFGMMAVGEEVELPTQIERGSSQIISLYDKVCN